ncbi:hypothetical protein FA13DRAFT_1800839 [Coprinellus micaceus]|uniref:G domain-containing protein n=1 Tax=Coprinellus micaceus TaxID=71717 RepID=A0A4Y7SFV6_COPMI|nr:hypothetical protein FA13DRAFT_1800839 [Coprinellus micaceus]
MSATTTTVQPLELELKGPYHPPPSRSRRVLLVDTPGFDHTTSSDYAVRPSFANGIFSQGVDAVLYFHSMTHDVVSREMKQDIQVLANLCGSQAANIVTIVTTRWDVEHGVDHQARLKTLRETLWKPLLGGGATLRHIHALGATSDVFMEALKNVGETPVKLLLQEELIDRGRAFHKTKAGRCIPNLKDTVKVWEKSGRRIDEVPVVNTTPREDGQNKETV